MVSLRCGLSDEHEVLNSTKTLTTLITLKGFSYVKSLVNVEAMNFYQGPLHTAIYRFLFQVESLMMVKPGDLTEAITTQVTYIRYLPGWAL